MPFLSFKGTTLAYLLKRSMAHNNPLLYLLLNYVSAKSTTQMLPLNDELILLS